MDHIQSQVRENTDQEEKNKGDGNHSNGHENNKDFTAMRDESARSTSNDALNKIGKTVSVTPANKNKIIQKELREHGLSSMKTWLLWLQRAGGFWFGTTIVILMAIDRSLYVVVEWLMAT